MIDIREKRLSVKFRKQQERVKAFARARAVEKRRHTTKAQTLAELEQNLEHLLCAGCNKNLPVINKVSATLDYCAECAQKERLVTKYGLTLAEYNSIWNEQDGKCAICSTPLEKSHIDHCHKREHVRGLLCGHCNTGLGFFRDNTDTLILAAIYLQRNAFSRKWSVAKG